MFPDIHKFPVIGLDTEGDGLYYPRNKAFSLQIATPDGKGYFWDFRKNMKARAWASRELTRYTGVIAAHNASFDAKMLSSAGVNVSLPALDCTCVRAVMIDETYNMIYPWTKGAPMTYSLDDVARKCLGERKDTEFLDKAREYFGLPKASKNTIMGRIAELPEELVKPYGIQDAQLALRLWQWQEQEIERQGIQDICRFERSLIPTVTRETMRGIDVDIDVATQAIIKVDAIKDEQQAKLNKIAGFNLNVNSTPQIHKLFEPKKKSDGTWVAIDGTPLGSTDKGNASFGKGILKDMLHPAAALIDEIRSLVKTSGTFLEGHIIGHEVNGKVYPSINQTANEDGGTRTGRFSYTDPAMQQIPSRNKKVACVVKPAFLPPTGMIWVDTDLHSFEVRVFASLVAAYNTSLLEAYKLDASADFHQYVAGLTGLNRNATYPGEPNAKQLNLAMIFNSGNGAIAHEMGMPWKWAEFTNKEGKLIRYKKAGPEAMKIINMYHSKIQGVKKLADRAKKVAEERGYVRTFKGRRMRFKGGYKTYSASGILIQSTSADINKENHLIVEESLGDDGHLILNTHDSYSMAMYRDNWEPTYKRVKEAIERPVLKVPLVLDLNGVGDNWWDALQGV